ncbi:hypothetical protein F383_12079 [Gossypium arboreum]|uniref:Uncharacterized protein n=1 Tax=Gossypium arboreum TaxID=29729 RepID=A0A0B0PR87_GOSAR|nr:hypothetical protein F383_12079 [Gossypium arboreum]
MNPLCLMVCNAKICTSYSLVKVFMSLFYASFMVDSKF